MIQLRKFPPPSKWVEMGWENFRPPQCALSASSHGLWAWSLQEVTITIQCDHSLFGVSLLLGVSQLPWLCGVEETMRAVVCLLVGFLKGSQQVLQKELVTTWTHRVSEGCMVMGSYSHTVTDAHSHLAVWPSLHTHITSCCNEVNGN